MRKGWRFDTVTLEATVTDYQYWQPTNQVVLNIWYDYLDNYSEVLVKFFLIKPISKKIFKFGIIMLFSRLCHVNVVREMVFVALLYGKSVQWFMKTSATNSAQRSGLKVQTQRICIETLIHMIFFPLFTSDSHPSPIN